MLKLVYKFVYTELKFKLLKNTEIKGKATPYQAEFLLPNMGKSNYQATNSL